MPTTKKRVSAKDARPIVTCAMCRKHVTKEMGVTFKSRTYCCAACAEAYQGGKK